MSRVIHTHEIVAVENAAKTLLCHPAVDTGWGTPAGFTLRCRCGREFRDAASMEWHIGLANSQLEASSPLSFQPVCHAAVRRQQGGYRTLCACGFEANDVGDIAAHIEVENGLIAFEREVEHAGIESR